MCRPPRRGGYLRRAGRTAVPPVLPAHAHPGLPSGRTGGESPSTATSSTQPLENRTRTPCEHYSHPFVSAGASGYMESPTQKSQGQRFQFSGETHAASRYATVQFAIQPAGEYLRVDVRRATHRRRVAEQAGDLLHAGGQNCLLGSFAAFVGQRRGRKDGDGVDGTSPGAEVLGRELAAGDFPEVVVDHAGVDGLTLSLVVQILEKPLTGQVLAFASGLHQPAVVERHVTPLAALAAKVELDATLSRGDVAGAQGGQAEGVVFLRVSVVTHADHGLFEQAHHEREHLVAGQAGQGEILAQASAQAWQRFAEFQDPFELVTVAYAAPFRVIPVLLAQPRIASGGLEVAALAGTDPYLRIGRRK